MTKSLSFPKKFKLITGVDMFQIANNLKLANETGDFSHFTEDFETFMQGGYLVLHDFQNGKKAFNEFKEDGMTYFGELSEREALDEIGDELKSYMGESKSNALLDALTN
jgi:hypothetical protein